MHDQRGDKFDCRYGDAECRGNRLQACVAKHTPRDKGYAWLLRFLECTWASALPSYSQEMSKACLAKVGRAAGGARQVGRGC